MSDTNTPHKSGYVAIVGKPNAGKSTLMNQILGTKLSITTHKAQTTRHQIIGIHSEENSQIIFLDTPGIIHPKYELQKAMMRFVEKAEKEADVILFIVEAKENNMPSYAFDSLKQMKKPVVLVINKIDESNQEQVEKLAKDLNDYFDFNATVYISALNGEGVPGLMESISKLILPGPPFYPKDELSEHPVRFFAAELIREQVFLQYHEELPYSATVDVIIYEEREDLDYINAEVIVNRNSQKGMIIGKGGRAIKQLGTAARESIEEFVGRKVFLDLHVKVRDKWRENENMVRNFGY
ncbi:MAG TPA: GTPase Era [Balneola sp.]|nr:GTPase Era [Bacteroidota bacterium]HCT52559.1 GTPase Era [Balneola sp.]|tara:strand:+ start:45505 stop:46392 length:888 start_codon:yes stop_codon:yes gene_type:complete